MLKKVSALILAVTFVLGALLLVPLLEGERDKEPHPQKPRERIALKPVYYVFATYSGESPARTETFHIDRAPWRLRWEVDGLPNSASAAITVLSANEAVPPVLEEDGFRPPPARGTYTINQTGSFYILVSSYDASWRLTIEKLDYR